MNRPEPLTPEERELARLLGRAAPSAPPAALDEAVLAAAGAAVQPVGVAADNAPPAAGATRAVRRPRSRLPAALGLAASLVFAVGIAWQLKPESAPPDLPEAAVDAAAAPMPAAGSDAEAAVANVAQSPAASSPEASMPIAPPAPVPARTSAPAKAMVDATQQAHPAPATVVAPVLAAPVPPSPEPAAAKAAPSQRSEAMTADSQPELDSVVVLASGALSTRALDAAVDADAALPRREWLKRIRERRDVGDIDTARASLERYLRQYPEVRVPRDLRPLLDP